MNNLEAARIMMSGSGGSNIAPKPDPIIQNGTYLASDDDLDGYSRVVVTAGTSVAEMIDNFRTIYSAPVFPNSEYTYKIKIGHINTWEYAQFYTNLAYSYSQPYSYAYPSQSFYFYDTFACLYKNGDLIIATRFPWSISSYQYCDKYREDTVYTWSDTYVIVPYQEWENISIDNVVSSFGVSGSSTKRFRIYLSADFVQKHTRHNWTSTSTPGEVIDNPTITTETYSVNANYECFPEVSTFNTQQTYTDLSSSDLLSELTDFTIALYNYYNSQNT